MPATARKNLADFDFESESARGETWNKAQLAANFGLTHYAIDECLKRGAPVVRRGSRKLGWMVNSAEFLEWYIRDKCVMNDSDPDAAAYREAKLKKTLAEIVRIEAENTANRESRVTPEQVAIIRDECSNIVNLHLKRIPGRVAAAVAAETDASIVEELVADEISAAMAAICTDLNDGVEDDRDSEE